MADKEIKPKMGRVRDGTRTQLPQLKRMVFRQAGKAGARAQWSRGHIKPGALRRGMGTGVRAASGLIAPGSRRVIVKARYTRISAGDLGAARAHLKYIQRDGVTREGDAGQLYSADRDQADGASFLDRSQSDPHQFRFIVSAEDSMRLEELKPFVRDLMNQMERDLETQLDWVAVDHFNTGHPHTHIVIRGRDDQGKDLVMARDYIGHGVRARAQGLITLELGPESELERTQKLRNEVAQERLTRLDRSLIARAKDSVLALPADPAANREQTALRNGRLQTLERLGLAEQRQKGVWQLDRSLDVKLRQLGDRADKFKMMQRALQDAGIDRAASALALFEKKPRKTPLIGKIVGVGMIDEISDRTWVILDAVDGRVHYAELGRLKPEAVPARGMIADIGGDDLREKPSAIPTLHILSPVAADRLVAYEGPTWLDAAIVSKWRPEAGMPGVSAELRSSIMARGQWLAGRELAKISETNEITPTQEMMSSLRQLESQRLAQDLSAQLKAAYVPTRTGERVTGVYERSIQTPTSKLAIIRNQDTFTLAPWKPALEPMRGRAVTGSIGQSRMTWALDRGRNLPPRG